MRVSRIPPTDVTPYELYVRAALRGEAVPMEGGDIGPLLRAAFKVFARMQEGVREISEPLRVRRGFYLHYKEQPYFVLGVGALHDTHRRIVVYESTLSMEDGSLRLRYEDEFVALVTPPGERRAVRRFTPIGPYTRVSMSRG